jgi:hypothetical protein
MAMGTNCWAHRHRELVPIEIHHVWPLGDGGPNASGNKVALCANAHSSTHDLLAKMKHSRTVHLPEPVQRMYGVKVRRLARAGFNAIATNQVQTL